MWFCSSSVKMSRYGNSQDWKACIVPVAQHRAAHWNARPYRPRPDSMTSMFTGKEADPVWAAAEITRRPTVVHEISHSDGVTTAALSRRLGLADRLDLTRCYSRLGTLALYLAAFTPSSVTLPCYHRWACYLLTVSGLKRPDDHPQPDNDDAEKFCQRWVWIVRNCMSS